ncbi:MAG: hypothetical protein AAGJ95_09495 [Cyanobacteria bacterium J06554_11]
MTKYDRTTLLKHHRAYLKRMGHRCQFTGLPAGGKHRYNFHHTSSQAYGREIPGFNYLLPSNTGRLGISIRFKVLCELFRCRKVT